MRRLASILDLQTFSRFDNATGNAARLADHSAHLSSLIASILPANRSVFAFPVPRVYSAVEDKATRGGLMEVRNAQIKALQGLLSWFEDCNDLNITKATLAGRVVVSSVSRDALAYIEPNGQIKHEQRTPAGKSAQ
jgi:hypothetical protein